MFSCPSLTLFKLFWGLCEPQLAPRAPLRDTAAGVAPSRAAGTEDRSDRPLELHFGPMAAPLDLVPASETQKLCAFLHGKHPFQPAVA